MKKIIISTCILALSAGFFTSCGDQFQEEYPWMIGRQDKIDNKNEEGAGAHDMDILERELKGAIPFMLNYSHEPNGSWQPHKYQYYRTNSVDNYAGYWTTTKANFAFGPALPWLYKEDNGYLGGPLDNQIFLQSKDAIFYAAEMYDKAGKKVIARKPEWRAIALIIQAYFGHEIVDFYGVAPFMDWRNVVRTTLKYQSGPEVYKQIFADLDEAIAILHERQPSAAALQRVEGTHANKNLSDGDYMRWIKFANSIKLRMAMNMVDYVDPDPVYGPDNKPFISRNIAEEAVAGGVLEIGDRDFGYKMFETQTTCCLYFMSNSWNDIRLGASMENIMKHFKSPLLTVLFSEHVYAIKDKLGNTAPPGVFGVRTGIPMEDTSDKTKSSSYGPFSTVSDYLMYMDQPFMKLTEVLFLRAEGALRGWSMGGTAQSFYEDGIREGIRQYRKYDNGDGVVAALTSEEAIETYLNGTNLPVVDYVDYYQNDPYHNCVGRVSCDVKWNDGDSQELKLEKIISQKYIANYPMGAEAWTTFRRTGYPRLFPVTKSDMAETDLEMQIRRMTFTETNNNGKEISQITELLGGKQTAFTRVFWDVRSATWGKDANGWYIPQNF